MAIITRAELTANNTGRITPFSAWSNRSYLGRVLAGKVALGSAMPEGSVFDPDNVTKMNSEAVFVANFYRSLTGKQPLPAASSAPSVNIGVTPEAKALIAGAGVLGLVALLLASRRKK